jgi:uncharacterized protein YwgA
MNTRVLNFIKFLHINNLINASVIPDDTDDGFQNRLKLQKFVYIVQACFGLNLGYSFTIYRFGPYSTTLADQYYDDLDSSVIINNGDIDLPEHFNQDRFIRMFSGKDARWLELAATLVDSQKHVSGYDRTIEIVSRIKPRYTRNEVTDVLADLIECRLISMGQQ